MMIAKANANIFTGIMDKKSVQFSPKMMAFIATKGIDSLCKRRSIAFFCLDPLNQHFTSSQSLCVDRGSGFPEAAPQVFDKMRNRSAYNAQIRLYVLHGFYREAFDLFHKMEGGGLHVDESTFKSLLKLCSNTGNLKWVTQLHSKMMALGIRSDGHIGNILIDSYGRCGSMANARKVFEQMLAKDVVSWNSLIRGYVKSGDFEDAIEALLEMDSCGVEPDAVTVATLLPCCASLRSLGLNWGKEMHCLCFKNGFHCNSVLENALLNMYSKCGSLHEAHQMFARMRFRDVVSWNSIISHYSSQGCRRTVWEMLTQMFLAGQVPNLSTWNCMISGFCQNGFHEDSLKLLKKMVVAVARIRPDAGTLTSALTSCAQMGAMKLGKEICGFMFRRGFQTDFIAQSSVLDMYCKCGDVKTASRVFDRMCRRDSICWNALIAGLAQNGSFVDAIQVFGRMQWNPQVKTDATSIISVTPACASVSALKHGKEIHAYAIRTGLQDCTSVANSFIDLYAKCGKVQDARLVFDRIPCRDVVSWNAMISCYGIHGHSHSALLLFEAMLKDGFVTPNEVTFVALFTACNHAGLVEQGLNFFELMQYDCAIQPTEEHYYCMVDLLGRAGRLQEAYEFVQAVPAKSKVGMWASLLGSCRIHSNMILAQRVSQHLSDLGAKTDVNCTLETMKMSH